MQNFSQGMTVSKYLNHLASFARIAIRAHKPQLVLWALKYHKQAENCLPKEPLVIMFETFDVADKLTSPNNVNPMPKPQEKVFTPISSKRLGLLKSNYIFALSERKLSTALATLKAIGDELGFYNKNNYTKQEMLIQPVSGSVEEKNE